MCRWTTALAEDGLQVRAEGLGGLGADFSAAVSSAQSALHSTTIANAPMGVEFRASFPQMGRRSGADRLRGVRQEHSGRARPRTFPSAPDCRQRSSSSATRLCASRRAQAAPAQPGRPGRSDPAHGPPGRAAASHGRGRLRPQPGQTQIEGTPPVPVQASASGGGPKPPRGQDPRFRWRAAGG